MLDLTITSVSVNVFEMNYDYEDVDANVLVVLPCNKFIVNIDRKIFMTHSNTIRQFHFSQSSAYLTQ